MTTGQTQQLSIIRGQRVAVGATRVHELFAAQLARNPNAEAARFEETSLSYQQLDARSTALAQRLVSLGVGRDSIVGLCAERSLDVAVGVLGILKAGGAYLPLDPEYPAGRLQFMLEDSRVTALVAQRPLLDRLPSIDAPTLLFEQEELEADPDPEPFDLPTGTADDLAYVLFTSGSTGKPKGVAMPHGALVNLIEWQLRQSSVGAGERTLQFAPISFDVSFQELFATWAAGGSILFVRDDLRLDAVELLQVIRDRQVARLFLPFVAMQHLVTVANRQPEPPRTLREVVTAGEQLKSTEGLRAFFAALPECTLYNHYGPSETHVVTSYKLPQDPTAWQDLPSIGSPIDNCDIYILAEDGKPTARGEPGELCLAGLPLARGYLHRPELSAQRFVEFEIEGENVRLYRTGDSACLPANSNDNDLQFLGRIDGQVKVRGYRIELGEVEVALESSKLVEQAVVGVREDQPGIKRLVAYFVPKTGTSPSSAELRGALLSTLPDYMVPAIFMEVEHFPRTPSGKIDRLALPAPTRQRPELEQVFVPAESDLQRLIAGIWQELLQIDSVGIEDNFFDLGGNSLVGLQTVAELRQQHGLSLPVTTLYQRPTISALASYLQEGSMGSGSLAELETRQREKAPPAAHERIAIIGMGCRVPGADDVQQFWKNLAAGEDSITFFTPEELDPSIPQAEREDPNYVAARGIIDGVEDFDAAFFGVNPLLAKLMDPQQRIFMEVALAALEDAGIDPSRSNDLIGVYAGTGNNSYYPHNVFPNKEAIARVGTFQVMVNNEKDYAPMRVSNFFNLKGPAMSIHTACSTSATAVAEAVSSLRSRRCDVALAGAASVTCPVRSGYRYQEGSMLSKDGHCRAFDAEAAGTTFSDGAGAVVLKRLDDALAHGDRIYALIAGTGVNNDGADKASFTAPSVNGQAAAITLAQLDAQLAPESISYVEAHGTATPLGDPVEVAGLTQAFRRGGHTAKTTAPWCAIGSVKSNVGHLTAAAGVTGLIKTALALHHELLPASLHFKQPNPQIGIEETPFFVQGEKASWPRDEATPRRAGVSSFGVGGTNVHLVLEEAPLAKASDQGRPVQLLTYSAKTQSSLDAYGIALAEALEGATGGNLADWAYTSALGRTHYRHRGFVVCSNAQQAQDSLRKRDHRFGRGRVETGERPVALMFPGQGSQAVGMGEALYRSESVFKETVDFCAAFLADDLGCDLRELLYPPEGQRDKAAKKLTQTAFTQPALFTIEYALAKLWMAWGIEGDATIGHSIGEYVAACLSGVFELPAALKLVAARGRLMQELPSGKMLSVRAPFAEVEQRLTGSLCMAAANSHKLSVVSGPQEEIEAFAETLHGEGIAARVLMTSHAFHSTMMDPILVPFEKLVGGFSPRAPTRPFVSNVSGRWITAAEATDPGYWARHLRSPVRFAEGIATLWENPQRVLLEVGPRQVTSTLAKQQVQDRKLQLAIPSMGKETDITSEWHAILRAMGQLWAANVPLDFGAFYAGQKRRIVSLPHYRFDRKRCWIDPPDQQVKPPAMEFASASNQGGSTGEYAGTDAVIALQMQLMTRQLALLRQVGGSQQLIDTLEATLATAKGATGN